MGSIVRDLHIPKIHCTPDMFSITPLLLSLMFCSIPVASLTPLEWPIPSHTDQYELHIEVQPKPHHRAHYETEGSRGAVKAPTGGHPVVQVNNTPHYIIQCDMSVAFVS